MKPQYIIITLLGFSLYWMFLLYQPFLLSIMIAALLAVSTASVQRRLEQQTGSVLLATLISTITMAILFFAPLGYFLTTFTLYLGNTDINALEQVYFEISDWAGHMPSYLAFLQPFIDDALSEIEINKLAKHTLGMAGTIGSYSAGFLKNALLIIVFYFFAQYHGKTIFDFIKRVIGLPGDKVGQIVIVIVDERVLQVPLGAIGSVSSSVRSKARTALRSSSRMEVLMSETQQTKRGEGCLALQ